MDNNLDWLELYQQRDEWAKRAYQDFINQVDEALKADLTRSDQVTIVVYGSTQVGKTSLILKLLGIDDASMAGVSEVLRGGREMGKSATIMPIRYRRSDDDQWYIHDKQGKDTAFRTVEDYFKQLRLDVEQGKSSQTSIIDVCIPRQYFSTNLGELLDIRILDLPGIQAINKNEQHHVEQISAKYAANADIVILVGRSDDLAFLNPKRLMLEQFKYWTSQSSRFRVALTYAFSPSSVIDYVKEKQETFNLETFKDRIFEQLNTHDFKIPYQCRNIIFPLEFGGSLESIKDKNQNYFHLIENVNQDSFNTLYESIHKAANPYSRFSNGFDVQRLAKEKINEEKKDYAEKNEKLEEEFVQCQNSLDFIRANLGENFENINSCYEKNKEILNIKDIDMKQYFYSIFQGIFEKKQLQQPSDKVVPALKDWLKYATDMLRKEWLNLDKGFEDDEILQNFSFGISPSLDTKNLKECDQKLNSYWVDTYFSDDSFNNDYQFIKNAFKKEIDRFVQEAESRIRNYLNSQLLKIEQELKKTITTENRLKYIYDNKMKEIYQIKEKLKDLEQSHENFIKKMEIAKQHGEKFETLMKQSFDDACKQAKIDFVQEQDVVKKFYRLWYAMLLEEQYDVMMSGVSEC